MLCTIIRNADEGTCYSRLRTPLAVRGPRHAAGFNVQLPVLHTLNGRDDTRNRFKELESLSLSYLSKINCVR